MACCVGGWWRFATGSVHISSLGSPCGLCVWPVAGLMVCRPSLWATGHTRSVVDGFPSPGGSEVGSVVGTEVMTVRQTGPFLACFCAGHLFTVTHPVTPPGVGTFLSGHDQKSSMLTFGFTIASAFALNSFGGA